MFNEYNYRVACNSMSINYWRGSPLMYHSLKRWSCGWYSIKDFKYWYWVQDDFGNAVLTSRLTLGRFHNMWWISPVA